MTISVPFFVGRCLKMWIKSFSHSLIEMAGTWMTKDSFLGLKATVQRVRLLYVISNL